MEISEFLRLFKSKKRKIIINSHARDRLTERNMRETIFLDDIQNSKPVHISEQEHEDSNIKKFRLYYPQSGEYFHAYIVTINSELRLITVWRPSKIKQKGVSIGKYKLG